MKVKQKRLARLSATKATATQTDAVDFQERVNEWIQACFGPGLTYDVVERNFRFCEEALELTQACGTSVDEAHQLVEYVYSRPVGEKKQETGGVMVTLAALCWAQGMDMAECGEQELARVWGCIERIRAKQASKPGGVRSPLPGGAGL